jgi:hypothetical protein
VGLLFFSGAVLGQTGTSTLANPKVTFASAGLKQVQLEVCNDHGCETRIQQVVVLDPKPQILNMGSIPTQVGHGESVSFSAAATGRPALTYRWVLSNGSSSFVLAGNPAVWDTRLSGMGTYTGRLEVENNDGMARSTAFNLSVVQMTFADVPPSHWAWQAVETLYARGLTAGCRTDPLSYCPLANVTRAETAAFLVRATRGTSFEPAPATGVFSDVGLTFWAAPYIEQLYADDLTSGCGTNPLRYCPSSLLTRAEMAVFLLRARHGQAYAPPPATGAVFADVPATHWAAPWIERLHAEGITSGCATNPFRYCPDDTVTRAQMAAFLVRAFELTDP